MDLFDEVAKQEKFVYGDTIKRYYKNPGATARGSISGADAQVELPTPWENFNPTNNKEIAAAQRRIVALSVIHELIHLSGKKGYDDRQLANTVAAMKGIRPPDYSGMDDNKAVFTASMSWTESLHLACKARKK